MDWTFGKDELIFLQQRKLLEMHLNGYGRRMSCIGQTLIHELIGL